MALEPFFIGAAATGLSAGLTMLLRPLLARYAMARPNARSSHKIPTPQGGGISVISATLIVAAAALFVDPNLGRDTSWDFAWIAAATVVLAIVGAADDIIVLDTVPRLVAQVLAVVVVVPCCRPKRKSSLSYPGGWSARFCCWQASGSSISSISWMALIG